MMSIIILSEEKMTWIMGQFMCKEKYMCAKGKFIKYKLHELNASNVMIWFTSITIGKYSDDHHEVIAEFNINEFGTYCSVKIRYNA